MLSRKDRFFWEIQVMGTGNFGNSWELKVLGTGTFGNFWETQVDGNGKFWEFPVGISHISHWELGWEWYLNYNKSQESTGFLFPRPFLSTVFAFLFLLQLFVVCCVTKMMLMNSRRLQI